MFDIIRNTSFKNRLSRKSIILILSLVVVLLLLVVDGFKSSFWISPPAQRLDTDTTLVNANKNDVHTVAMVVTPDSVVPADVDTVYGIETVDKINWENLNIRLSDNDKRLHKVSFALVKCTSGMFGYLGVNYEYNRDNANKNGIYFASYHSLNVKPTQKKCYRRKTSGELHFASGYIT